jgi:peptidoglycan/LPS O-acetylase OafA/YrhL
MMLAPTHPLQLALGLIIWSGWFVLIYAALSIGCAFALPDNSLSPVNWLNALLLVLTLLATALLGYLAWRCWRAPIQRGDRHFIARVAAGVYLASAVSTLAIGLPVVVLPPCL